MAKLKIMLVDDHAVVRGGFKVLLQTWDDVEVVAEASSGEEALQLYEQHRPDVVVMDIAMAGMGGIEAIKRMIAKDPGARILSLSAHEDTSYSKRALQAGALGYLSKRTAPEVLICRIWTATKALSKNCRRVNLKYSFSLRAVNRCSKFLKASNSRPPPWARICTR
jgi:two-component system invasion response regulator UvrY